jgi:diguanylate cyclase (GGDEF)-like protein
VVFWERHLRISVLLYAVCNLFIWVYAALTWGRPHRVAIVGVAMAGLVVAVGLVDRLRHRIVASSHRDLLLYSWSGLSYAFVAIGAGLDGGGRSPVVLLVVVTLAYATLAYPPRAVVGFSAAAVFTYGVVGAVHWRPDEAPKVLLEGGIITLLGMLSSLAARNQWRSRRQMLAMAERQEHLATIDDATGCLNRRAFWARLGSALDRADQGGEPVSLLVVDIDHFKAINDTHGHLAGDKVLREVGGALLASVPASEAVGRIGGDEFAIVLARASADAAHKIAQGLLDAVHDLGLPFRVTVSIGLGCYPGDAASVESLFEAADRSLYRVKATGRDAVACAPGRAERGWAASR